MWSCSHRMRLSGDIELNLGPKRHIIQCLSHWNLNTFASHNVFKIQSLIAYNCVHKFRIICLFESYLNSKILPNYRNWRKSNYNSWKILAKMFWFFFLPSSSFWFIISERLPRDVLVGRICEFFSYKLHKTI